MKDNYDPSKIEDKRGKQVPCAKGWVSIDGACHIAFTEEVTWFEAEGKCQRLDGHLVSIHSESKNSQVTSTYLNTGVHSTQLFWAGAKRNNLDGFAWTGNLKNCLLDVKFDFRLF